jgi:hypothetical protein
MSGHNRWTTSGHGQWTRPPAQLNAVQVVVANNTLGVGHFHYWLRIASAGQRNRK